MGLAPSGCRCFARISRRCEVPVPIFSQPLSTLVFGFQLPGAGEIENSSAVQQANEGRESVTRLVKFSCTDVLEWHLRAQLQ